MALAGRSSLGTSNRTSLRSIQPRIVALSLVEMPRPFRRTSAPRSAGSRWSVTEGVTLEHKVCAVDHRGARSAPAVGATRRRVPGRSEAASGRENVMTDEYYSEVFSHLGDQVRTYARGPYLLCKQGVVGSSPIVSTASVLVKAALTLGWLYRARTGSRLCSHPLAFHLRVPGRARRRHDLPPPK